MLISEKSVAAAGGRQIASAIAKCYFRAMQPVTTDIMFWSGLALGAVLMFWLIGRWVDRRSGKAEPRTAGLVILGIMSVLGAVIHAINHHWVGAGFYAFLALAWSWIMWREKVRVRRSPDN